MLSAQELEFQAGKLIAYAKDNADVERWFASKDFCDKDKDAISELTEDEIPF